MMMWGAEVVRSHRQRLTLRTGDNRSDETALYADPLVFDPR